MARERKKIDADTVTASCFALKMPGTGRLLARLSAAFGSWPELEMFDGEGRARLRINVTSGGPRIEMIDAEGELRTLIHMDDHNGGGEPEILLIGGDGTEVSIMPAKGHGPTEDVIARMKELRAQKKQKGRQYNVRFRDEE